MNTPTPQDNLADDKSHSKPPTAFGERFGIDPEAMKGRRILIIVENLPVPFDRRVWLEAQTLNAAGAEVSIICPATKEHPERRETLDGIHIYRHPLNDEGTGKISYIKEYATALF